MNPKVKRLEIEIGNYGRAVAKREREIEHFKKIIEARNGELEKLRAAPAAEKAEEKLEEPEAGAALKKKAPKKKAEKKEKAGA